jgi:hypothetical protein
MKSNQEKLYFARLKPFSRKCDFFTGRYNFSLTESGERERMAEMSKKEC